MLHETNMSNPEVVNNPIVKDRNSHLTQALRDFHQVLHVRVVSKSNLAEEVDSRFVFRSSFQNVFVYENYESQL